MHRPARASIAVVGVGPRGVSIVERIGASLHRSSLSSGTALELHLIEDTELGAGRIWRTDQDRELCMNTLADAVTLFVDEAASIDGPIEPGPTLFQWCRLALREAGGPAFEATDAVELAFAGHPVREGLVADYAAELARLEPWSHPSRPLYGEYLVWCLERALAALPPQVEVIRHRGRAVAVEEAGGRQRVELDRGGPVLADAVVWTPGWLPPEPDEQERRLGAALRRASPALLWIRPGSPVDQGIEAIPDRAEVLSRGLGMGFFDAMALLSLGRGGRFAVEADALRYEGSGREPRIAATSPRGIPFLAKSRFDAMPPRAEQRLLRAAIAELAGRERRIDFDEELWPAILRDAYGDFCRTLHRVRPEALSAPIDEVLAAIAGADAGIEALDALLAAVVPDPAHRFPLAEVLAPVDRRFASIDEHTAWVRDRVAADVAEARLGADSPIKAGLWSLGAARGPVARFGAFGRVVSPRGGRARLVSVGGLVGSGPPLFRSEQLLALIDAGLVRFVGPSARVDVVEDGGAFEAVSPLVGQTASATVLLDAWMHANSAGSSTDALTASLHRSGRLRPFPGDAPGGVDIEPGSHRLIRADGAVDPAIRILGIPLEQTVGDTIISPMPRTDPSMLRQTDRVAREILASVGLAPAPPRPPVE